MAGNMQQGLESSSFHATTHIHTNMWNFGVVDEISGKKLQRCCDADDTSKETTRYHQRASTPKG